MAKFLIINGPNLNLLGQREPELYGSESLTSLHHRLKSKANTLGHELTAFQSNAEHELVQVVQDCAHTPTDFIILNPAAYTHSSIALRDALLAVNIPFIEVHISQIYRREPFRHHSYFSDIAVGTISGLGTEGYLLALQYAHHYTTTRQQNERSTII